MPETAILHPVYPNPANASFNLCYDLNSAKDVRLHLYNVLGQVVWRYTPGMQARGRYNLNISDEGMTSGIYFLQMDVGSWNGVRKITIVR